MASPDEQRGVLEGLGCDVIIHERSSGVEGARRVTRLLFGLKSGDEIAVQSLGAFLSTTGELARILRDLLEVGAAVIIAAEPGRQLRLAPSDGAVEVLAALAEHEAQRPTPQLLRGSGRIGGGSRNPLSPYQIDYARKLHAQGASLRSIGQLFQISPEEVWRVIAR
jgi:hypothetical protein